MSKASTIVGIAQAADTTARGWANFGLQAHQYKYQRELQNTMFAREDTAIRRAAADMEAAGLSKTLAVGSPAEAGEAIKTQAPQVADESGIGAIMMGIQLDQMLRESNARIDKTAAEAEYTRTLNAKAGIEAANARIFGDLLGRDIVSRDLANIESQENIAGLRIRNPNIQRQIDVDIRQKEADIARAYSQIDVDRSRIRMDSASIALIHAQVEKAEKDIQLARAQIRDYEIRGNKTQAETARLRLELLQDYQHALRDAAHGGKARSAFGKLVQDISNNLKPGFNEQWYRELLDNSLRILSLYQ